MAYFPFFVELSGKKGLIIGGGTVALRKAEKLLPYGPELTLTAPRLLPELEALSGLTLLRRPFGPELLEGMYFVIAATGDLELNHHIAALCRARGILVNVVDDREHCSFLFPALVQDGPLSVGISTGGASPTAAVWVKERIAAALPEDFGALLDWLESVRPAVRAALPEQNSHGPAFTRLFSACLELGRPLETEEWTALLAEFGPENGLSSQTVDKV